MATAIFAALIFVMTALIDKILFTFCVLLLWRYLQPVLSRASRWLRLKYEWLRYYVRRFLRPVVLVRP